MRLLSVFMSLLFAFPALAHEFWISPEQYMIQPGDQLRAHLRVGEKLIGPSHSYIPRNFRRFDVILDGNTFQVPGVIGNRPAMDVQFSGEGLVTIVHVTTDSTLTYNEPGKFDKFVKHKAADWAIQEHKTRGLPEIGFKELYSRYGKSLVAVGAGGGSDSAIGLTTEIVALANPYTDDLTNGLTVQILHQGEPRAAAQLEIFERNSDDEVSVSLLTADDDGRVTVPVQAGSEYLLDSVVIQAIEPDNADGPVWESLWASLTFQVPE